MDAAGCLEEYQTLVAEHGNKMITLSECGSSADTGNTLGLISEQWNAGTRWSWFMPWYDADNSTLLNADQAWWEDAMSQDYVIKRGEFK